MTANTLDRNATIEKWRGLFWFLAGRDQYRDLDRHDLTQFALTLALVKWDQFRGGPLGTWIKWVVFDAARRMRRQRHRRNRDLDRARKVVHDRYGRQPFSPPPGIEDEEDEARSLVLDRLRQALVALPADDRRLLAERYGLDGFPPRSFREMESDGWDITYEGVRRRERKLLGRLRQQLTA